MDERILKWLFDIKLSIDEIESFFDGQPKDFFEYKKNLVYRERSREI